MSNSTFNKEIWPNFFIVGAMKAGTTSLYRYLERVPGIYMSPNKEPNYFASEDIPDSASKIVIRDREDYLNLFANVTNEKAIGEASTNYLYSSTAPGRIYETVPRAKIIMILRDPIQRAFSQYLSNVRGGNWGVHRLSFMEALKIDSNRPQKGIGKSILYVEKGMYYEQTKRYLDTFGEKNVKIIIFEEYIKNTYNEVKSALSFLNIDTDLAPDVIEDAHNQFFIAESRMSQQIMRSKFLSQVGRILPEYSKTRIRRRLFGQSISKPTISPDANEFLRDIFYEDVTKLESLLGRDLPWSWHGTHHLSANERNEG